MTAPINPIDSLYVPDQDTIENSGNNTIIGGNGNDIVYVYGKNNNVDTKGGNDIVVAVGNENIINAGDGNNYVYAKGNSNKVTTGAGEDDVTIIGDFNELNTGDGADKAAFSGNNNIVSTGNGDDEIQFMGSNNTIDLGDGNNKATEVDSNFFKDIDVSKKGKGAWGDPHYHITGANGKDIKFDHKGIAGRTYEVFSGDNLYIDGLYAPHGNAPCVISETTITAGSDQATFDKNGNASINGEEIQDGSYTLEDGTEITVEGNKMTIVPSDGTGMVEIYANASEMTVDPSGQFKGLGGILGTAIAESRTLTEEEGNAFDVTGIKREPKDTNFENPFLAPDWLKNL